MDENVMKFQISNNQKYKVEVIWNNKIYVRKLKIKYLPKFYHLVFWKNDLENKYLKAFVVSITLLKTDKLILERPSQHANDNFTTS